MADPQSRQVPENQQSLTCDSLRKTVTPRGSEWNDEGFSLYRTNGERKYLNKSERRRALEAMSQLKMQYALFALVLAWTGARVSEVLALTPHSFQIESGIVTIVTLKRRRFIVREVPVPPELVASLDRVFGLRRRQSDETLAHKRMWPFCRMTAWRIVKQTMVRAGVAGTQACPKGLRHAFAICSLHAGVPINLVQRWMGHARLSTTAIYLDVCGPEEKVFAGMFWRIYSSKSSSKFT